MSQRSIKYIVRGLTGIVVITATVWIGCAPVNKAASLIPVNPPVGVVNNSAGFYFRYVTTADYTYNMHKGLTTFTTDCVAKSGEIIDCYLEAEEHDLFHHGVKLQFNVPSDLCSYLIFSPYFYYTYEVGAGVATVQEDTDKLGKIGIDTNNDGTFDLPLYSCPYDYTLEDGPNCCTGTYTKTKRAWNAATTSYDIKETTTKNEWGGRAQDCIAGPAVDTQTKNKAGFPLDTDFFVQGVGINKEYEIKAPETLGLHSNIYAANYFELVDHAGAEPPQIYPFGRAYKLSCIDRAYELKSEINLYIREWNTVAAYDNRVAAPTQHSITGVETTPFTGNLNDWADWKDFGINYPRKNQ